MMGKRVVLLAVGAGKVTRISSGTGRSGTGNTMGVKDMMGLGGVR